MNEQTANQVSPIEEQKGKAGQVMTKEGWKDQAEVMADWKDPPLLAAFAEAPPPPPSEVPPALGLEAAERMQTLAAAAARDILLLGQAVLDIAETINAECRRMAEDMAQQGNTVSQHIRDFSTIARTIGVTNRDTRLRIAGEPRQEDQ